MLKRTPLYDSHARLGARFVEFGGWEMPVLYTGINAEHMNVREHVGLFDVSHMGEIFCEGENALAFLQHVTSNDVSKLTPGKAQYSLLLNHEGGVVDDIIIYQLKPDLYLLCVNASNADKDYSWLEANNSHGAKLRNASNEFAQIAIQGPKARELVAKVAGAPLSQYSKEAFPFFTIKEASLSCGGETSQVLIACTGYTGEDGFEIFCSQSFSKALWESLLDKGADCPVLPIGLGARDTLRLEAGLPLHGHELRDDVSALWCGVSWAIKFSKDDFIGKEVLLAEKSKGIEKNIVGFFVEGAGIVREAAPISTETGEVVGWSSSGTKTPCFEKPIGLGFVNSSCTSLGTKLFAEVRGRKIEIEVTKKPHYKRVD